MDVLSATHAFRAVPAEAGLAMPTQSLYLTPERLRRQLDSSPRGIFLRRLLVIGGAVVLTGIATWQMELVLGVNGLTPLALFMLILFVALFAWVALSFTSALAGFVSLLGDGGKRLAVTLPSALTTRTALLMPCYNESPHRVTAALQAMMESLQEAGTLDHFDVFILSDTTDPDIWVEEEAAFLALRAGTASKHVFYRRRGRNVARKAGNIADWVTRWGGDYPQFLILDADSVMQATTLCQLVAAMQAHPDVGLIQTLPIITGGVTVFARMQQFAGRVYGPLIAHGIAWWHGAEGNYWGHNAMIRTRAFAEQAGLPELSGRKPFGGHILSHDFIEAALMRRGGWAVHMMPALRGSYEESPPSLMDLAVRDRRWCQGNLQHIAILPARGLRWISRMHLLTGIGSYLTSPLWLLFLLTGILIALQARFVLPDYFPDAGKALFPVWPVVDPVRAMWMFVGTMGLLLVPKVLGVMALMVNGPDRRGSGGGLRLLISLMLETVVAGLLAPVVMLTQSVDVILILAGSDSGWNPQRRDDGSVPLIETVRRYRRHTMLGVTMGVTAWLVSPALALWMSPVVLGLTMAVPLAMWTSRRIDTLGRLGLLQIPEETAPPVVLTRTSQLRRQFSQAVEPDLSALQRLLKDPSLQAAHRAMLPLPRRPGQDPIDVPFLVGRAKLLEAASPTEAWSQLTRAERAACLANSETLDLMLR